MEWIPVKERLPRGQETILFCTEDVHSEIMFPLQGYYIGDGKWMGYLWSQVRKDVTHWMEMPEPPKQQKSKTSGKNVTNIY